jgi:hypothetical protein
MSSNSDGSSLNQLAFALLTGILYLAQGIISLTFSIFNVIVSLISVLPLILGLAALTAAAAPW